MKEGVGPILTKGDLGDALMLAILELNPGVKIEDRGAYYRVENSGSCRLTKTCAEKHAKRSVTFPRDLEAVMPSFTGLLQVDDEKVYWSSHES